MSVSIIVKVKGREGKVGYLVMPINALSGWRELRP